MEKPEPTGAGAVECYRGVLFGVAYRLVGTAHDAENMVQESFSRWNRLDPDERALIVSPRSWLLRVVSRVCLDHRRSAGFQRRTSVGDWLPEPLPDRRGNPMCDITLDESVSIALVILLEEVTPTARAIVILHDVFGLSFTDIGEIVGCSPAACRHLAVVARRHVRPETGSS